MTALNREQSVGIIGAGAMGSGIAQIAATAGHTVLLYDTRPHAAAAAIEAIGSGLSKLVAKRRMGVEDAASTLSRVQAANNLRQLSGCGLIIEAVLEDLATKQQVFREVEAIADPECLLATNTSSLSITGIAAGLQRPERLAGMHFFNPAPVMELVEVVSGLATSQRCSDTIYATAEAWGKTPVHAKSTPGFIVNRVARPFYGEALRMLSEGAASPASIDAVLRECGGFRMGPFELMDLIGHDVNFAVTKSVWEAFFFDPRFQPSLLQQELVAAGRLGRKSGQGFYNYQGGENTKDYSIEASATPPAEIRVIGSNNFSRALEQRLSGTGIRVENAPPTGYYEQNMQPVLAAGACLAVTDGSTASGRARASETANLVFVDYALDYLRAKSVAVAKSATCGAREYSHAVALLQAAGFSVVPIRDLPGMIVLRTLAMLANEAADAVNTNVCSVSALNVAMRKGVNYPIGPLEWADDYGVAEVWSVLENIRTHYGEPRYRVSPLFQELMFGRCTFRDFANF